MKGLVGGAEQYSAYCRRNWTAALIPRSSGTGTHPFSDRVRQDGDELAGAVAAYKVARRAPSQQGRTRTGIA